jgi:hypothetical protein
LGEGMILELNSIVPLVTILGAAAAPTIAAIWAEGRRKRDARKAAETAAEAIVQSMTRYEDRTFVILSMAFAILIGTKLVVLFRYW